MRLGIIGAGHAGGTLGRLWEAQGHDVRFGVRNPDTASGGGLPHNRTGTVADVAAFGDVIVLATPWEGVASALAATGPLTGKTLIDCTNPLLPDLSGLTIGMTTSAGEEVARLVPAAKVVKCFNTLGASNFANPELSVQHIAEQLACSADYLSHLFHTETKERLIHYIQRIRIDGAILALEAGTLTISEIAYASGFSDPAYFARVFKQHKGAAPQEFRAQLEASRRQTDDKPKTVYHDHLDFTHGVPIEKNPAADRA